MKIMVINPNSSEHMTRHLDEVLQKIKRPDTELRTTCPKTSPYSIESAYDEALSISGTLELVEQAESEGYDAVILACFSDPGLDAAREISNILIMGIEETALHVAAMMGYKFTVLTSKPERIPHKYNDIRRFKLEHSVASIRALGMSVSEMDENTTLAKQRILEVSKSAAEQDGAEVIVLGCAGMAGYAEDAKAALGVEVIDPSSVTLKVAEALIDAGIRRSKRGLYAVPASYQ